MTSTLRSTMNYRNVAKNETLQRSNNPRLLINDRQMYADDWSATGQQPLSPSQSIYATPLPARSREIPASPRPPSALLDPAKVAPEIVDIRAENGTYRVQLNLNANFIDPSPRPSSAFPGYAMASDLVENRYSASSLRMDALESLYKRPISVADHFLTGRNSHVTNNRLSSAYNEPYDAIPPDPPGHARMTTAANSVYWTHPTRSQLQQQQQQQPQKRVNSTSVVTIDGPTSPAARSGDRSEDDEFVIKSVKSSVTTAPQANLDEVEADDHVKLDLTLFAKTLITETAPIVESETVKIQPTRRPGKTASRKARPARAVDEVDASRRKPSWRNAATTNSSRSLYRETLQDGGEVERDGRQRSTTTTTTSTTTEVDNSNNSNNWKETMQRSCNTDPELASTGVQTVSLSNTAAQTDVEPERPEIERVSMSRSAPRQINDDGDRWDADRNHHYRSPPPPLPPMPQRQTLIRQRSSRGFDAPDFENGHLQGLGFVKLLREGTPRGSLRKKMDVRKEDDQIVGPLPKEEVDRMYNNSMINVDSVSEKVDLSFLNGVAQLIVKITYERIVPIEDSQDTFKKSAVVVTKVIDVDLKATEERRKIYDHVLESHKNGRLDNKFTFELYKAFMALSESDDGATSQEHSTIEKKVDEEKLWNMKAVSSSSSAQESSDFQRVNFKILENKLSDFSKQSDNTATAAAYRPSASLLSSSDAGAAQAREAREVVQTELSQAATSSTPVFRPSISLSSSSFDDAVRSLQTRVISGTTAARSEPSDSFVWKSSATATATATQRSTQQTSESLDQVDGEPKALTTVDSYNRMLSREFLKRSNSDGWRSIFNDWTEEATKVTQKLDGHLATGQRKLEPRMNVHEYLRPGGSSRTRDPLITELIETMTTTTTTEVPPVNETSPDEILASAGIQSGSHRQRMASYGQVLDESSLLLPVS